MAEVGFVLIVLLAGVKIGQTLLKKGTIIRLKGNEDELKKADGITVSVNGRVGFISSVLYRIFHPGEKP